MGRLPFARWLRGRPPEPGEPVPDAELLARFAGAGDEAAFELLVWRHAALVLGVCRRVVRDDHLAEDAFQAAFLVLARKAGSVRGANLAGWLFRVARRVSARARRQAEVRGKRETLLDIDPIGPAPPCPAEDRECLAVLDEEVARLPERLRRPVLLCYLGGRTTEDAARALGCPRGTVLSRLATARERLAARLTRRGVTLPAGLVVSATAPSVSGVVPPAVRASLAFLATGSAIQSTNPILLANGALTAMKLGKTVAAGVALVLTAGLLGGFAFVTRGGGDAVAFAAADPPAKADAPKPAGAAPKAPPTAAEKQRDDDLRKLRDLHVVADGIQKEIDQLQRRIEDIHLSTGLGDPDARRRLAELAARSRELDRELVVEEVRDLAKAERDARRRLAEAEQRVAGVGDGETRDRSLAPPNALAAKAAKDFQLAREKVRKLDDELTERIEREARTAQTVRNDLERLTRSLESKRALVARLDAEQIRLELRVLGVESPGSGGPSGEGVNELLKEVRELRREVQELKRK